jgi:hydrogenase nickel incorporation protein HypB
MCATCGCDGGGAIVHAHDGHVHTHADDRTVVLQQKILAKNDGIAERNRAFLAGRGVVMVNLMSSPGAGKTTLLERTARELAGRLRISVIEGDQETELDAGRIRAAGCAVVQVNTGTGCHLDAEMVSAALRELDPAAGSVVVVENVGNLVCPALFDLGEVRRIVLASVPEGEDKPAKYPHMFRQADLVLVSKVDLLPYLRFDLDRYLTDLGRVAPSAGVVRVSAQTGAGLPEWYDWLTATARPA